MAPKAHKAALAELSFSDFTVRLSETEDEFVHLRISSGCVLMLAGN